MFLFWSGNQNGNERLVGIGMLAGTEDVPSEIRAPFKTSGTQYVKAVPTKESILCLGNSCRITVVTVRNPTSLSLAEELSEN